MVDIFKAFTIEQVVGTGIALIVVFAGIVSIMYVIWGGFLMVISAGAEEKVKAAVNHIRHAFIGVLLILTVLFVFPTFFDLIGLEYGDFMRPNSVLSNISSLSDHLFGRPSQSTFDSQDVSGSIITDDFSDF